MADTYLKPNYSPTEGGIGVDIQTAVTQRATLERLYAIAERNRILSDSDRLWAWSEWQRLTAIIKSKGD